MITGRTTFIFEDKNKCLTFGVKTFKFVSATEYKIKLQNFLTLALSQNCFVDTLQ